MHDPITYKVFSPHIHIVFLKNTGNVFDMASLQLLAIKPKSWRDLVSDEPFTREDIVTIQVSLSSCTSSYAEIRTLTRRVLDDMATYSVIDLI
jgi:hypothetical protein